MTTVIFLSSPRQNAALESAETVLHHFKESYRLLSDPASDPVIARSSFSRSRAEFWILYARIRFDRLSAK
jgi:hypothetical protein